MSPFWGSFAEHFKGCGRNATLFLIALGAFAGLMVLAAFLEENLGTHRFGVYALRAAGGIGLVTGIWLCVAIRRSLARRRQRLRFPQLSSDELDKARSKLRNRQSRKSL
jgi:small neutral amino acid transporter SnatA (MarC family)